MVDSIQDLGTTTPHFQDFQRFSIFFSIPFSLPSPLHPKAFSPINNSLIFPNSSASPLIIIFSNKSPFYLFPHLFTQFLHFLPSSQKLNLYFPFFPPSVEQETSLSLFQLLFLHAKSFAQLRNFLEIFWQILSITNYIILLHYTL